MSWRPDWEGVVEIKRQRWEAAVRQHQCAAQLAPRRVTWRRRVGAWLMHLGGQLTQVGARMAEGESRTPASIVG